MAYLEDYARTNGVLGYVRFGRVVTRLRKDVRGEEGEWVVNSRKAGGTSDAGLAGDNGNGNGNRTDNTNGNATKNKNDNGDDDNSTDEQEERFDYISIANGHYEKVMIPEIPGLK